MLLVVAAAQREPAVDGAVLRHVADPPAARPYRPALDQRGAAAQRKLAEQNLQQRRLAGPVGTEDRDELSGRDGEIEVIPEHPVAEGQPGPGERDDVGGHRTTGSLAGPGPIW
jgi:hypothetical protein